MTKNILDLDGKALDDEIQRIIKTTPHRINRPWTQKELDILKKLHEAGIPARTVAKTLGRSIMSVNMKIQHSC